MSETAANKSRQRKFYKLFLGVDGGGTKTNVALMNESGVVIAEAEGGASNPLRVGVETAVANIEKAVISACDSVDVSRGDIVAATLGLAGTRRRDMKERVRESFVSHLRIRNVTVTTDAEIALYG